MEFKIGNWPAGNEVRAQRILNVHATDMVVFRKHSAVGKTEQALNDVGFTAAGIDAQRLPQIPISKPVQWKFPE